MRIDIGSNSIRPELILNRNNIDSFEFKNRGENVRSRVIDVNQNMVLIQTSTGKEFVANTTIPMENFIGEEMLFTVLFNDEGQIFLKPQLDEKKQNLLKDLKVEDLLIKLGKSVTPENKEIVKQMIKSGTAVTSESFKEIKDLSLSLKMFQNNHTVQLTTKQEGTPLNDLVRDFGKTTNVLVENSTKQPALPKELGIKDIIMLKSLSIDVSPKNLKAIFTLEQNVSNKNLDILDIKSLLSQSKTIEPNQNIKVNTFPAEIPKTLTAAENKVLFEDLFKTQKFNSSNEVNVINEEINKNIKNQNNMDFSKLIDLVVKKFDNKSKFNSEDLKLDYNKIESELKKILSSLESNSKEANKIEKDILPRLDLLKDLSRNIQYQVLPFQIDKYENIAQYYFKKNKRDKSKDEGITVAFSIETHELGNVRAMLNYRSTNNISVNIVTETKPVEDKFKKALPMLQEKLNSIGFTGISISTEILDKKNAQILDDVIYKNIESKSFETWV